MNNTNFDFLSNRLTFIDVAPDPQMNINLWHYFRVFENYVYGVFLQFNRIIEGLNFSQADIVQNISISQASLDIYYYTLTWDKLKKINEKIKKLISQIQQSRTYIPTEFKLEFKNWKHRIEHLFKEFDVEIRNQYEHPSLEFYSSENMQMWGNIFIDRMGNIKAHVGKDYFATIKKEHFERILVLRSDLFDLFLKYFSQKPLNQELIKVRDYIEENIEKLENELNDFKGSKNSENFNKLFRQLISYDLLLLREGLGLSSEVRDKIYSVIHPIS